MGNSSVVSSNEGHFGKEELGFSRGLPLTGKQNSVRELFLCLHKFFSRYLPSCFMSFFFPFSSLFLFFNIFINAFVSNQ